MNLATAAARAGVSRRSLYYWMQNGTLPFTTAHGSRQVALEDVEKLRREPPRECERAERQTASGRP